MKNSIKYLIIFGIMGFLLSCGKGTDSTPAKVCKLQSQRNTRQGSSDQVLSYEYNAQKQIVKIVETSGSTYSKTSSFTYDANGFLTALIDESIENGNRSTNNNRFEYKNNQLGLLSSQINLSNGTSRSDSYAFEYDAQQKLSKVVYSQLSGARETYTFSNDKLIGYVERSATGVDTQPYVIENGLIKRKNYNTGYETYEYDTQGRQIRNDTWSNGRIVRSAVVAYEENGKNPEEASPLFLSKGWYDFKVWLPFLGEFKSGLRSRTTNYLLNGNNLYKYEELVYNNVLNAKGFPTQINTNRTTFSATGAVTGTSNIGQRTYTYTDCE